MTEERKESLREEETRAEECLSLSEYMAVLKLDNKDDQYYKSYAISLVLSRSSIFRMQIPDNWIKIEEEKEGVAFKIREGGDIESPWREMLEERINIVSSPGSGLREIKECIINMEEQGDLVNKWSYILQNPSLLIRNPEDYMNRVKYNSVFQSFIAEEIFKEKNSSRPPIYISGMKEVIDGMNLLRERVNEGRGREVVEEVGGWGESTKEVLGKLRWYEGLDTTLDRRISMMSTGLSELPTTYSEGGVEYISISNNINIGGELAPKGLKDITEIGNIYETLIRLLEKHCRICLKVLGAVEGQGLLNTYTQLWESYVHSIIHLNYMMQPFAHFINSLYESAFPGYPCFPKFTIWRLMANFWRSFVLDGILLRLSTALRSVFISYRVSVGRSIQEEKNQAMREKAEQLSLQGEIKVGDVGKDTRNSLSHIFIQFILTQGVNSLIDLSCNELTVRWTLHSTKSHLLHSYNLHSPYSHYLHSYLQPDSTDLQKRDPVLSLLKLRLDYFREFQELDLRRLSMVLPPCGLRVVHLESNRIGREIALERIFRHFDTRIKEVGEERVRDTSSPSPKGISMSPGQSPGQSPHPLSANTQIILKIKEHFQKYNPSDKFIGKFLRKLKSRDSSVLNLYANCPTEIRNKEIEDSDSMIEYSNKLIGIPEILSPEEIQLYSLSGLVPDTFSKHIKTYYNQFKSPALI